MMGGKGVSASNSHVWDRSDVAGLCGGVRGIWGVVWGGLRIQCGGLT